MSAGRGIKRGVSGTGGRGNGDAAGRIDCRRDDGRLRCDEGTGAGVHPMKIRTKILGEWCLFLVL